MSMSLGPIHHWLYNKIQIAAERSRTIEEALVGAFPNEADPIMRELDDIYQAFPEDIGLEDILGDAPIHGFLNSLIRMIEMREGGMMKLFLNQCGDKVKNIAVDAAKKHGEKVGEGMKSEVVAGDIKSLFKALNDCRLEGMPCDEGGQPEVIKGKLIIRNAQCLHYNTWDGVGAPLEVMCHITGAWIEGFFKGAAPDTSYSIEESIIDGNEGCMYSITTG